MGLISKERLEEWCRLAQQADAEHEDYTRWLSEKLAFAEKALRTETLTPELRAAIEDLISVLKEAMPRFQMRHQKANKALQDITDYYRSQHH